MVLVYILIGVIALAALSVVGIYIERREKRRFEREELSHLLERPAHQSGDISRPGGAVRHELAPYSLHRALHEESPDQARTYWCRRAGYE